MAFNLLFALVAFSIIAATANASMMLDQLDLFIESPGLDTFTKLVMYQLWGFFAPFIAGPLETVLSYVWEKGAIVVKFDTSEVSVGYPAALGFVGVGNFEQLFDMIMDVAPKIMFNMIAPTIGATKDSYG